MVNKLPIPDELQHLLEKRLEADRREEQRRKAVAEPLASDEADQRCGRDRRQDKRRRKN